MHREQRNWYWKKSEQQKEHMKREYPSTPQEAFEAAIEGSFYGKYLALARQKKQVSQDRRVPHDPTLPVDTWWDLGIDDSMTIVFVQYVGREIRFIDFYENSGEGIPHYVSVLDEKRSKLRYTYGNHVGPFDIMNRELATGKSRWESAQRLGVTFLPAPKLPFEDGIDAVRNAFPRFYIDPVNCAKLIESFTMYRKEWDDKLNVFKSSHVHDLHSHRMDAVRTGIVGMMDQLGISVASTGSNFANRTDVLAEKGLLQPTSGGWAGAGQEDEYDKFGLINSV